MAVRRSRCLSAREMTRDSLEPAALSVITDTIDVLSASELKVLEYNPAVLFSFFFAY